MRSLVLRAGLAAALVAVALPAAAASSSLDVAWTGGHRWWPESRWHDGPPHATRFGSWWPGYPLGNPWRASEARLDTLRREIGGEDARLRHDRSLRLLNAAEFASLRGEGAGIRGEARRIAAMNRGLSSGEFHWLQGEVDAWSGAIRRDEVAPA
jgi:hypothetical protein